MNQCQHESYAELVLTVHWTENGVQQNTKMGARFHHSNLRDYVVINRITMENIDTILPFYPFLTRAELETWIGPDNPQSTPLWDVTMPYNGIPYAWNLLTTKTYGATLTPLVQQLRQSLLQRNTIHLMTRSLHLEDNITELNMNMDATIEVNPLNSWYPPDFHQRYFIQLNQYPKPEKRPKYAVTSQLTFPDTHTYRTTLGFGAIQEYEFTASLGVPMERLNIRLIRIPGADNHRYYGFLELPVGIRVRPDDKLLINFWPGHDARDEDWSAFVITPLPCAPLGDASLLVTRRFDKTTQAWSDVDVGHDQVPDFATFRTPDDARAAITHATPIIVNVKVIQSKIPLKRQINSLNAMEENNPAAMDILLGSRVDNIPPVDLYATIDNVDARFQQCHANFNTEQLLARDMCQSLPAGLGLIEGTPGTGKSMFIRDLIMPLILEPLNCDIVTPEGVVPRGNPHRILVLATINDPVNDLAAAISERAKQLMAEDQPERSPIVIRLHAMDTEKAIALRDANNNRPRDRPDIIQFDAELADEMVIAKQMMELYEQHTHQQFQGIDDKRVKKWELSLGYWMLWFSRVLPTSTAKNNPNHNGFRDWFRQYLNGDEMSPDNMSAFTETMNDLRVDVLGNADVVVTTLSNAADFKLHTAFQPGVIIVDEAAKAIEPDFWSLFGFYHSLTRVRLLVGDSRQLRAVVQSNRKTNGFAPQLGLSLFSRLDMAGFPMTSLSVQHRFNDRICVPLSNIFYDGRLVSHPSVNNRPNGHLFNQFLVHTFNLDHNIVFINVRHSEAKTSGGDTSRYNEINIAVVVDLLRKLLTHGFKPADLGILTPYQRQWTLFGRAVNYLQAEMQGTDLRALTVEKFDSFQGREKSVIIADLTVTNNIGFLDDGPRINVALSRARDGLIIVGAI